jgi:hypothetical protein
MTRHVLLITVAGAILTMSANAGFAAGPPPGVGHGPPAFVTMGPPPGVTMGPPPGVTHGPPPGVTMGPPPGALTHIPTNVPVGRPSGVPAGLGGPAGAEANAANELGKLNAAHASPVALQHAAPNSAVGTIATYESQMNEALMIDDPVARDAAITAARQQLALASNKRLTPSAIMKVDDMLGISGASPTLGTTP